MKHNRAKLSSGINARVSAKLIARTIMGLVNYRNGRLVNQEGFCWLD